MQTQRRLNGPGEQWIGDPKTHEKWIELKIKKNRIILWILLLSLAISLHRCRFQFDSRPHIPSRLLSSHLDGWMVIVMIIFCESHTKFEQITTLYVALRHDNNNNTQSLQQNNIKHTWSEEGKNCGRRIAYVLMLACSRVFRCGWTEAIKAEQNKNICFLVVFVKNTIKKYIYTRSLDGCRRAPKAA